jgi:hypothetical protein
VEKIQCHLLRTIIWFLLFCLPISAFAADKVTLQLKWFHQDFLYASNKFTQSRPEIVLTKSFPQIKRLPVENTLASLKAVTFGRADAALGEEAVLRTLINKNLLSGLHISGEVDIGNSELANLRLGVRDDWPLLQSALMKAMAAVTPQEMAQIRQTWVPIETDVSASKSAVPISYQRLIIYGLMVFL